MARKCEVLPPITPLLCDALPSKINTTANIGVKCFALLTKLYLDSIEMMCGCSSQVANLDVSAAILDTSFKTSTPFTDTFINETLRVFATR